MARAAGEREVFTGGLVALNRPEARPLDGMRRLRRPSRAVPEETCAQPDCQGVGTMLLGDVRRAEPVRHARGWLTPSGPVCEHTDYRQRLFRERADERLLAQVRWDGDRDPQVSRVVPGMSAEPRRCDA